MHHRGEMGAVMAEKTTGSSYTGVVEVADNFAAVPGEKLAR